MVKYITFRSLIVNISLKLVDVCNYSIIIISLIDFVP
jgi:hypothetical protein